LSARSWSRWELIEPMLVVEMVSCSGRALVDGRREVKRKSSLNSQCCIVCEDGWDGPCFVSCFLRWGEVALVPMFSLLLD
jgi:hypothetical protein